MSNTPNDGQGQPGSAPQPGAWGRPPQAPGADAADAAPAWGSPSGYDAAPQAQQPAWGQPTQPAEPATPSQAPGNGWQQAAQQSGWDVPPASAAAGNSGAAAPGWDQPTGQGAGQGWAQNDGAAPGYAAPGGAASAPGGGYAAPGYAAPGAPGAPGAPVGQGGYAVNYAVPAGVGGLDGATNPDDLTRPLYGATFGQAIKRFFKNYVNFNGRASRSEFWWAVLGLALVQLVPAILYYVGFGQVAAAVLANTDATGTVDTQAVAAAAGGAAALVSIGGSLMGIISLAILLPSLGLFWRRLHDANFSGLFFLLNLVPGIGSIVVLVLCALESKPEGRRFDPAPGYRSY